MDQIKAAMKWLKENSFWVGSALLTVVMLVTWVLIAMNLDQKREKLTSDILTKVNAAEGIRRVSAEEGAGVHPNSTTEEGMKELMAKTVESVAAAWKARYEAQQKILKWPEEIAANESFMRAFGRFNPAESYPTNSGRGREGELRVYAANIKKQMERITKNVLRAKWIFDPAYEDIKLTPEEELAKFAVVWNAENQRLWNRKLTQFRGWDGNDIDFQAPIPLQMYMLQQDLWLLEAMFEIIREVNGDATANDLAKIKKIDHIAFGRETGGKLGALTSLEMEITGGGMMAGGGPPAGMMDRGAPNMGAGTVSGDGFNWNASNKAFHGRYVDAAFNPLSADMVFDVINATKADSGLPAENVELIVAKRVPVRIALRMDEREIPNFLKACANSPFVFEIHQMRKDRHVPGEGISFNGADRGGSGGGLIGGRGGEAGGMDRGMRMGGANTGRDRGEGAGTARAGGAAGAAKSGVETRLNYDIDVEFFGIVKIYNPPNEIYLKSVIGILDEQAQNNAPNSATRVAVN